MSRSLSLIRDEEYAPARPRSEVMMTTPARLTSFFSPMRGWSSLAKVATADTARVIARAYGVDSRTACCALMTRLAAMSSMARVIFFVELTARMRCRYSRICAPIPFRLPSFRQAWFVSDHLASGRAGRARGARPHTSAALDDDLLLLRLLSLEGRVVLGLVARHHAVAAALLEALLELVDVTLECLLGRGLKGAGLADRREQVALRPT